MLNNSSHNSMMELYNQEYEVLVTKLEKLKTEELNKVVTFGKYKGKTIQEIYRADEQYLYWLIRESNMKINPILLGLEIPTCENILKLLDLKYSEGEFVRSILYPAIYDDWNVGHYGCSKPKCIEESTMEYHRYTFDDILNTAYIDKLYKHYPYIKWTKEYIKSLFNGKYGDVGTDN